GRAAIAVSVATGDGASVVIVVTVVALRAGGGRKGEYSQHGRRRAEHGKAGLHQTLLDLSRGGGKPMAACARSRNGCWCSSRFVPKRRAVVPRLAQVSELRRAEWRLLDWRSGRSTTNPRGRRCPGRLEVAIILASLCRKSCWQIVQRRRRLAHVELQRAADRLDPRPLRRTARSCAPLADIVGAEAQAE